MPEWLITILTTAAFCTPALWLTIVLLMDEDEIAEIDGIEESIEITE